MPLSLDLPPPDEQATLAASAPALPPMPAQRWQAWQALGDQLEDLLTCPGSVADFAAALGALADTLDRLMREDDNLGVFEVVHINPDKLARYGVLHSLHCAVVVWLIGQRKEWPPARRGVAVRAALTQNIAVTDLQTQLALQAGPLTSAQRAEIREHPLASASRLRALGVQDADWLQAVEQHHEQVNGKGYPLGLQGEGTVSELADALRTCDVFCAKMSPRAGRTSMLSPAAAAAIFRQRSAGYFGATVVTVMGLYPPGSLVTLASGEQALVLERTADPMRPQVAVLTQPDGTRLAAPQRSATTRSVGRQITGPATDAGLAAMFPVETVLACR